VLINSNNQALRDYNQADQFENHHHSCSYHHLLYDSTHNFRKPQIPHRLSNPLLECELETIARESKNGNPIDQFTFDTTAQALSPWQDGNIVELNDAGEWFVNTPDIAFNDIGDLLDAEEAMFQEMQEGWITYEEFDAFENYVLNHTIGDDR
jgi:hypothetical protein